eukprot:6473520-Amphidinium_carterae.2
METVLSRRQLRLLAEVSGRMKVAVWSHDVIFCKMSALIQGIVYDYWTSVILKGESETKQSVSCTDFAC